MNLKIYRINFLLKDRICIEIDLNESSRLFGQPKDFNQFQKGIDSYDGWEAWNPATPEGEFHIRSTRKSTAYRIECDNPRGVKLQPISEVDDYSCLIESLREPLMTCHLSPETITCKSI